MTDPRHDARTFLPLTESTFLILISLAEPRHGYGIMQDVAAISEGRVQLGAGTLYGALTTLLKRGLIERMDETGAVDERRKVYALTSLGRDVVTLEGERLAELARLAQQVAARLESKV